MSQEQIDILQRALKREKAARKAAEKILEDKSRDLYETSLKLEKLLDEKSSQLQGIFENIVDAYVVMDLSGNVIKFNDAAETLFGFDIHKQPLNVVDLIYKEDFKYAMASFNKLKKYGFFKNYEARVLTKSGNLKWVHINASIVYDKNKVPIAAQGIVRDISARKASAERLIKSESRLSSLISNLDSGVLLEDEGGKIVLTNKKFCELFEISVDHEELKGEDYSKTTKNSKALFKNEDKFTRRISEILEKKETVLADELIMKNGTVLERDFIPILKDNIYRGHLWTYKDVTLNRTYRKSLEAQKEKYSNIIANMNLGLMEVNTEDEILMVNQSFIDMSGYSGDELVGKKGGDVFLSEKEEDKIKNENRKRQKGASNSYELEVKNKSGELKHWLISGAPNYNLKGDVIGSIGIHLDITEKKKLEIQKEKLLNQLEKSNDELHEYAHIVSHDLKSPLRSLNALTSWIKEDNLANLDETSLQNFDLIESTLEKMEKLISDILDYSSLESQKSNDEFVDLNRVIQNLLDIMYIPENISVTALNELPKIKGEETKFQQLFQNLIGNAIKFNDKEKGTIDISVEDCKSFYQFSVRDNGIGIEKKNHNKIFKIFHSLNDHKDSSGIGLSIVKKIVDLYSGEIWIESELNKGSTFYFTLKK